MPIQPRAASLRLNAASNTDQELARRSAGSATASSRTKARTWERSSATPSGSATGSKTKLCMACLLLLAVEALAQTPLVDLAGGQQRQGIDERHRLRALVGRDQAARVPD